MKATDEHREDAEDIAAALADLKRTVNAPSLAKGTAEPILGPGWCTCGGGYDPDCPADHGARPYYERLPVWVVPGLGPFEDEADPDGALQWLRENELAAWPESFVQAPCRVRMMDGPRTASMVRKQKSGGRRPKMSEEEQLAAFLSRREERGPDECWPWLGCFSKYSGHGVMWWRGKTVGAHRVAYEIANGPIPDGMHVLHSCDNPVCMNPAHLSAGTKQNNVDQMMQRGRHRNGHTKVRERWLRMFGPTAE